MPGTLAQATRTSRNSVLAYGPPFLAIEVRVRSADNRQHMLTVAGKLPVFTITVGPGATGRQVVGGLKPGTYRIALDGYSGWLDRN